MSNPLTRTLNLTIDLKLCGLSRPTACLHRSRTADATISRVDTIETIGNLEENELSYQTTLTQLNFLINPPSWATAARGESRLEVSLLMLIFKQFLTVRQLSFIIGV